MKLIEPLEEERIIHQFNHGDEQTFAMIYRDMYQPLFFFALRFVNEEDAQDILSEVFVSLWSNKKNFTVFPELRTYLFISVRNRCINLLKREQMKSDKQEELFLSELYGSDEEDLDMERLHMELISHIYEEITLLPPKMREIFLLTYQQGLKPATIAKRLQLSVQTVRNQKSGAIQRLRNAMGDKKFLSLLSILIALQNNSN